jgi:hypothetical protein
MTRHLLVIRVLDLGEQPWNVLTAKRVAEYPADLNPNQAARRTFAEFPGARVYMHGTHPGAPMSIGPQTIARVMPPEIVQASSA